MWRLPPTFLALAIWCFSAFGLAADPVQGLWQTEPDDGEYAEIRIAPCGEAFCGIIERAFDTDGEIPEGAGLTILYDLRPNGDGVYSGRVWRPSNDKTYYGNVTLSGNQLSLRGCVMKRLLCASQEWTRLE